MSQPEVRTESLGGSPLSVAARSGRLGEWFAATPRDGSGWRAYARDVAASVPSDWFDALGPAIAADGSAAERLRRSAGGNGVVITTGQQPGLFGGPIMTLAKAISARAIADAIADASGLPVAPLFWSATDDADFEEGASIAIVTDAGCDEVRNSNRPAAGTPMASTALDATITMLAERLRAVCGSAPHASTIDVVMREYANGATVGGAYTAVLRALLEPLEIAVLDASHPAVTNRARGILSNAVRSAERLGNAVHARTEAIRAAGFDPQVEEVENLSLVAITEDGIKRRLPLKEAARLSDAQLQTAQLSSTVLLRPVMERAILPTASYVGGPGEVAYFAQVTAVADALGAALPRVLPRWSTTIVEPRTRKVIEDLGMSVEDFADPHAVEGRIAKQRVSPGIEEALRALRADVARDVDALRSANGNVVPAPALEGARRGLEHRIERLERRVLAGVKRHESGLMRQIAVIRGSLYPQGIRQERRLAFVPFLAKYGPDLLEQMLDAARTHARALVADSPRTASASIATPAGA